jgi:large subunit ribosomal protein L15
MDLHSLKNTPGAKHSRKRVGRGPGSGLGKTSGKGHKGQMAREGHKHKFGFEGGQMPIIRRIPKRGFTNSLKESYVAVNVADLARFTTGDAVTPDSMREKGLGKGVSGSRIKVLGNGELLLKLIVSAHAFSASARNKIEAAGGRCEVLAK